MRLKQMILTRSVLIAYSAIAPLARAGTATPPAAGRGDRSDRSEDRPDAQARARAPHQRGQGVRRAAGLARPLHDPGDGGEADDFAVEGLPAGLAVDPATGQISGTLEAKGEYRMTLRAQNALGRAERPFKIVCGDTLALTPHMGWNSWYVWENHVTDKIMREAAEAMVDSGMIDHGYMYVNIDDCWSVKPGSKDPTLQGEERDKRGLINSNPRFPDMKALTDYIHAKGLKAGIYTSPGPLTCAGHVAAYQHEEQDVERFVEWGFDFLKYDWCSYGTIAKDRASRNSRSRTG